MSRKKSPRELPVIGWREWVSLPGLEIPHIKAKIDTGARSSSVHAFHVRTFHEDGKTWVRFSVHPVQRETRQTITAVAELLEYRRVKSSGGHETSRPVIVTTIDLLGQQWPIELTLANRDTMGFRMLLGRESFRDRFLIDPGHSYLGGVPAAVRPQPKPRTPRPVTAKKRKRKSS